LTVPFVLVGTLTYRGSKTPMAPRRAPLAEQIERRISDPLCGAGGGFPLRQREYTFSRRLPSGQVTLLCGARGLGPAAFPDHNAVPFAPPSPPLRVVDWGMVWAFGSGPTKGNTRLALGPDGVCYASVVQRQYISFPS
jgi:hypothetical protein